MARYTGPSWKQSRRLKYSVLENGKELQKRNYAPGQHGQRRAKLSEYAQQLALMCSANEELPDVLLGFKLGNYVINQYGEDGYFLDLTDYIDEYAPNYKAAIKKLDDNTRNYIQEKGKHLENGAYYGMPRVNDCETTDQLQSMMHINKTWLDKLGLETPTTIDELRTVLQAFKTQDPNGNGQPDGKDRQAAFG